MVKLKWMNGEYLKAMANEEFYKLAEPYVKQVITGNLDLTKIMDLVKTRIEIFPDLLEMIDFLKQCRIMMWKYLLIKK
jgi:glutamyl-tRNA synthetase